MEKNQDFIYRKVSTLSHETFRPVMQFLFFAIPYVFTQLSGLTDVYIMNAIDYDAFFSSLSRWLSKWFKFFQEAKQESSSQLSFHLGSKMRLLLFLIPLLAFHLASTAPQQKLPENLDVNIGTQCVFNGRAFKSG